MTFKSQLAIALDAGDTVLVTVDDQLYAVTDIDCLHDTTFVCVNKPADEFEFEYTQIQRMEVVGNGSHPH